MYVELARHLAARHRVDTWRVDPHGVGDSDGDFADTTFASERDDYKRVIAQARKSVSAGSLTVVGHSLGCALALHVPVAGTVTAPTVFIRGTADAWFARESVTRVADAMPNAALVIDVDGADHNFLVEGSRPRLWAAISAALG